MAIKLGNTVIGAIRLGAGEIANAYLGGVKVFTTIIEYLLDVYSGAKAAYSLRSLSTSYTGPVVEVRRDSDNAAKSFNDIEVTDGTMADWINNVPPLEIASGAAAAYSLRNLSFSYTGDVVEVRRASDDTTSGFTAAEVSDGTMADWVGLGVDGYVTTWYDQSGNGNDAVQNVATSQPKIVENGVVLKDANGKPEVVFDGSDDTLSFSGGAPITSIGSVSTFTVASNNTTTGSQLGLTLSASPTRYYYPIMWNNSWVFGYNDSIAALTIGTPDLDTHLFSATVGATTAEAFFDGTSKGTVSAETGISGAAQISGVGNQYNWNGNIQELIIYDSDQSAKRTDIEDEIGHHYGISMPTEYTAGGNYNGYVTTWYDQSGNGNDAAQATATSQPKIYDATTGLIVDSDGKPTLDFDGSDDYLDLSNSIATPTGTLFTVANLSTADTSQSLMGGSAAIIPSLIQGSTSSLIWGINSSVSVSSVYVDGMVQSWADRGDAYTAMVTNNQVLMAVEGLDTDVYSIERIGSGQTSSTAKANGTISEIIIYDTDESANRTGIESNINSQYSIY